MNLKQARRATRKIEKKVSDAQLVVEELLKQRALKTNALPIAKNYVRQIQRYVKRNNPADFLPVPVRFVEDIPGTTHATVEGP